MHYDETYFQRQKKDGEFGAYADMFKFRQFVKPDDTVLDFGCGGGYLLDSLACADKAGIEVNPSARQQAQASGIKVHDSVAAVPNDFASLVISNHALEHVDCPFQTLVDLKAKIKAKGRLVFVVPHENPGRKWKANDVDQHLYTWNPMTLGNLFSKAGYRVESVDTIRHKWPRGYMKFYQLSPLLFHFLCKVEAFRASNYQVRVVAVREAD